MSIVDPFGAAEVFATGAVFELAAPGVIRVLMVAAEEDGTQVIKVKLLIPVAAMPACIAGASAFVDALAGFGVAEMPLRLM